MIDNFTKEYAFLSNFYPSKVIYEGIEYDTIEHAYQAAKTLNPSEREFVRMQTTPGRAKRIGQKVHIREDWEDVKIGVMLDLIRQKFKNELRLKNKLLATGTEKLVEGNTWGDTFWVICNGIGFNNLGKILMKVRNELNGND